MMKMRSLRCKQRCNSYSLSLSLSRLAPRGPCFKSREEDSQTVVQPYMWFKEEPSQLSMGQTEQSLPCSIMEKPHTGLDERPRILLSCFRAGNSTRPSLPRRSAHGPPLPSCPTPALAQRLWQMKARRPKIHAFLVFLSERGLSSKNSTEKDHQFFTSCRENGLVKQTVSLN